MSNKSKYFTRGGQIVFHNLRMLFQINKSVGKMYILSLLVLSIATIYVITPHDVLVNAYYYGYSKVALMLVSIGVSLKPFHVTYDGYTFTENAHTFLSQYQFVNLAMEIKVYAIVSVIASFIVSLVCAYFCVHWLTKKGEEQAGKRFIRGSKLSNSKGVAKIIRRRKMASDIEIDGLPMIKDSETQHILVHGTTGAGKGQLLQKFLDRLRERGDRVILYDKGCSFTQNYFREDKDILLNPFDTRCANWDLWKDAKDEAAFETMAESLIPMAAGESNPFWIEAARTIFSTAAYRMRNDKDRSIKKLLRLLLTADLNELSDYLNGTEAATLVNDKIEKTAISIRSELSTNLKSLRFLREKDGLNLNSFSIRDWISEDKGDQWLIISSNAEQHAAIRPLISLWLSMASVSLLSLTENLDRRIWLIIDELPSLHKLPELASTIAEVRKFGGCFVLGMQSYAQLEKVYGRNGARSIFDLLNTRFFFRSPSSDMARLVSQELGEQEIEDLRENYSYGANRIRDGISIGRQHMTRSIVTAPELMEMPDLKCYLRLPGQYPIVEMNLIFKKRDVIADGFKDMKIINTNPISSDEYQTKESTENTEKSLDDEAPKNPEGIHNNLNRSKTPHVSKDLEIFSG